MMPKYDGLGPEGRGSMTGRGKGFCVIPVNTTAQEIEFLKNQEQALKKQLKHVTARIKRIENKAGFK